MEWHPHWFMKWLVEAGFPAYVAAGLSFYAVRTALKVANDSATREAKHRAEEADERKSVVLLDLEHAMANMLLMRAAAENTQRILRREGTLKVMEETAAAIDHAMKQHVPDADVVRLVYAIKSTASRLRQRLMEWREDLDASVVITTNSDALDPLAGVLNNMAGGCALFKRMADGRFGANRIIEEPLTGS